MCKQFLLLTLASFSLSSCFSFGYWGFDEKRTDITPQPPYKQLTKKTLKTQRDYYLSPSHMPWDHSEISHLVLNERQSYYAILRIPKGTRFKLCKVEQVYATQGNDPKPHYRGDYATLYFPHLQSAQLLLPILAELRNNHNIYRAPWQTNKVPNYHIHDNGELVMLQP